MDGQDIAFSVSELSRSVLNPGKPHLEAAKHVFCYLRKTINLGLVYRMSASLPDHPEIQPDLLWGYVDSDWAGCPDLRRSTSGFVFMLNGAATSWRSKRQLAVDLSSAEAEFIAASSIGQVIFLRYFLTTLGFPQTAPTLVFADNETRESVGGSDRAKHVDLRMHFAHELAISNSTRTTVSSMAPTFSPRLPRLLMSSLTFAVVSWGSDPKRLSVSQEVKSVTTMCEPALLPLRSLA